jgi:hypothetical protein
MTALLRVLVASLAAVALTSGCGRNPAGPIVPPPAIAPAAAPAAESPVPMIDRARTLGIEFTYRNGQESDQCTMLESLGGGVAWVDFDRDGWLDLLATGGGGIAKDQTITGRPGALFRNELGRVFHNVSAPAAIESAALYTNGVSVADYDQDGFQDALVTGYGTPQLWRNLGDGTFVEASQAANLVDPRWGSSSGWADLNGDGDLDLYIAHYVNWSFQNHPWCNSTVPGVRETCPPRQFDPVPHVLYWSRGDGTFEDASSYAGLRPDGKGLGVLLCDVELDGDVDIYVANDTTDNFLYVNDGQGKFEELGIARGVALDDRGIPNGSMGVDLCDFNRDGRPDLWVANYEQESFALYRNEGRGHFLHVSQRLGITDLGDLFVGFGTACEDFDSDGDQDFVVANGHVLLHPDPSPRRQLPLLVMFEQTRFQRATATPGSYFGEPHEGRGLATADYDRDGDVDIAISHLNEPIAVLENRFHERPRFLSLSFIGTRSNRDAIGAIVDLELGGQRLHRQLTGGGSYQSHSSRSVHIALPPGTDQQPRTIAVRWPSGHKQTIDASAWSGHVTLVEPLTADETEPRIIRSEVAP